MENFHHAASRLLEEHGQAVAASMVDCYHRRLHSHGLPYQVHDAAAARSNVQKHLQALSMALRFNAPEILIDHLKWFFSVCRARGETSQIHADWLECLDKAIKAHIPDEVGRSASKMLEQSREVLAEGGLHAPPLALPDEELYRAYAESFVDATIKGDNAEAARLIEQAVSEDVSLEDIYLKIIQPALYEVGRRWQLNHVHAAKGHVVAATTQRILMQLNGRIFSSERIGHACVVTCAGEEMHEVGARIVADVFEMKGWDTHYTGTNLTPGRIIERCKQLSAGVLCVSVTMAYNLAACAELIREVREDADVQDVIVLVGGQVFNLSPVLWRRVGADGYGADALEGVRQAQALVESR